MGAMETVDPDFLFSFVGATTTHHSRPLLLTLNHPRGLLQCVNDHSNWNPNQDGWGARRAHFAESIMRSKFVLCPRGHATSSIRFYEVMAAGRVPVVISDDWVVPQGLDFDSFAIRWPEGIVDGLLERLESLEEDSVAMGREAKRVFNERFAEESVFDLLADQLCQLSEKRPWDSFSQYGCFSDPRLAKHFVRRVKRRIYSGVTR